MGMSKEERAAYEQLTALIASMQNPKHNAAQDYLTQQSLTGAEYFKKGDYSSLPKGQFFNFDLPTAQNEQYKKYANVSQGGTFALANAQGANGARSQAQGLQSKYLSDRFARDASQNYQNNIANAAQNIQGGLQQAAGYQSGNDANVINALSGLFNSPVLQKHSIWGSVLGTVGGILGGGAKKGPLSFL